MQRSRSKTLFDVLKAIKELESFLAGIDKEQFLGRRQLQLAVEREFEIMGEALNRLLRMDESAFVEIRDAHKIVGLRSFGESNPLAARWKRALLLKLTNNQ